jgi:hypothetical protein
VKNAVKVAVEEVAVAEEEVEDVAMVVVEVVLDVSVLTIGGE